MLMSFDHRGPQLSGHPSLSLPLVHNPKRAGGFEPCSLQNGKNERSGHGGKERLFSHSRNRLDAWVFAKEGVRTDLT